MDSKGPYPSDIPGPNIQMQMPSMPVNVGPNSVRCVCPSCHSEIMTKMTHNATAKTHAIFLLLCCCMCWPCACLPYCMDTCRNANHYCPNCNAFIGTYQS